MWKITFSILCMVVYYQPTATMPTMDENDIGELVMNNYFAVMKASGRTIGCRPEIVLGPKGSVIEPYSNWRGNVALVVGFGECPRDHQGFLCAVCWGDGSPPDSQSFEGLKQCQFPDGHQYAKEDAEYTVTAFYCGTSSSLDLENCDTYTRTIKTSFNPGNTTLH